MFTHSLANFNGIILLYNLAQDWMARVKVRLSEGCRPTRALRYANANSGKLVNWTTGAYGVIREPSFHLPDQELCETTLQEVYIISLPHLYLLPRWVGYVPEMTRSGIPSFSWLYLFQDTRRLGISILFNSHHPNDLYDVSPSTAAYLMGLRAVCGTPGTIGRGPVAIPADPMAIE